MSAFFIIAGIVATIIGLVAIAILSGVLIAVRFFGVVLHFGYIEDDEQGDKPSDS